MNVKIAKNSGFCFGVKRAIKIALKTSRDNHEIVTLGPIIHNPQMVEKLEPFRGQISQFAVECEIDACLLSLQLFVGKGKAGLFQAIYRPTQINKTPCN